MMRRLIIQADEELLERARHHAAERGVSVAQVVRDALERELGVAYQPEPLSLGRYRSGQGDLARRASEEEYEPPPWRSS